jgi:hypothetical protein
MASPAPLRLASRISEDLRERITPGTPARCGGLRKAWHAQGGAGPGSNLHEFAAIHVCCQTGFS